MKALRLSQLRTLPHEDHNAARAHERKKRIPVYAERVRNGRPLFEQRIAVTVKRKRLVKKAV